MKHLKHFASPKQKAALRKLFSLPHPSPYQIKPYYVSGTKIFLRRYIEICRYLLSVCFKNAVLERQEKVQYKYFFLTQNRNTFAENL